MTNTYQYSTDLPAYRSAVQALPVWTGRTGNRDLDVLLAMLDIGASIKSSVVSCSTRQLSEATGKKRETVSKALDDLLQNGWITRLEDPEKRITDAPSYSLLSSRMDLSLHSYGTTSLRPLVHDFSGPVSVQNPRHMVFDNRIALGVSAYRVYSLLAVEQGTTAKELTAATTLHRNTVSAALRTLKDAELARNEKRTWFKLERDLDALQEAKDARERRTVLKAQHKNQQEGRRYWLKEHGRLKDDDGAGAVVPTTDGTLPLQLEVLSQVQQPNARARAVGQRDERTGMVGDGPQSVRRRDDSRVSGLPGTSLEHAVDREDNRPRRDGADSGERGNRGSEDGRCLKCGSVLAILVPKRRIAGCRVCAFYTVQLSEPAWQRLIDNVSVMVPA
jgi:DNA-binding MarR family transcriptional regulator